MKNLKVNCLIGDIVYKICPKCNDQHNGTCKNCAWSGCIWNYCSIDIRVYEDGSCNKKPLQVVKRCVRENDFIHINEQFNITYFASEEEALKAIAEYDKIRSIEDNHERYNEFIRWEGKRRTDVNFESEVAIYERNKD